MRIEILRLPAFGGFTDKELRFDGSEHCLHLVHGPNEAGKSTILRAITSLLFGFKDQNNPDAYLHPARSLNVGALLRLGDGSSLELVRYKRRKNDLVDGSGQVVDQSRLVRLLGGISQDMFGQMFGLDQEKLRLGAEGLLRAEGNLGQTLFAAASGIANLRNILEELETRRDGLFRPRAFTSSIHKQISELSSLSKRLRELSIRPAHWKKLQSELKKLQSRQQELQTELFSLDAAKTRLQRYRDALRHIEPRATFASQLAEIDAVPLLAEDFTERRTRAQQSLVRALRDKEAAEFRRQQVFEELRGLTVDHVLIGVAADVQRLFGETGQHRKALKDARQLESKCMALHVQVQEKLDSLDPSDPIRQGRPVHPISRQLKVKMDALSREHGALRADMTSSTQGEEEAEALVAEIQEHLERLPAALDPFSLEVALAKAAETGNPTKRLQQVSTEMERLSQSIDQDLTSLGLWRGAAADLQALALPLPETLDHFATVLQECREELETSRKEERRLNKVRLDKTTALQHLELHGELPDPASLAESRKLRDKGWKLVQQAWIQGQADPEREKAFLAKTLPASSLAEAFTASMFSADEMADRLYANASTVAQAMALRLEISRVDHESQACLERSRILQGQLEQKQAEWAELWQPLGIAPRSPREMQAWLGKARDLRQRLGNLQERQAGHAVLKDEMRAMTEELALAIQNLGQPKPDATDYATVLTKARQLLKQIEEHAARRKDLEQRLRDAVKTRDNARQRRTKIQNALEVWSTKWAVAMHALGQPDRTTPETAAALVLTLEEIAQARARITDMRQRIKDIQGDYDQFATQVMSLYRQSLFQPPASQAEDSPDTATARSCAPDGPTETDPLKIVTQLHTQLDTEQEHARRQKALHKETRQLEQDLDATTRTIRECETELHGLCAEAGVPESRELQALENASRSKAKLIVEQRKVEERLLELAGGEDLEEFISAARMRQVDELSAELEQMKVEKTELGAQRDACLAETGRINAELRNLDGTSHAADINQRISFVSAQLQNDVREYVRLRLASRVLSTEIERYREANQGPVLEVGSRFFKTITMESFSGLQADYDERGDPVIKAVRNEEQRLMMDQLSEGTRDQLFLALRLGALTRYLQTNPPLPLIADDILVNFDDQRCAATLNLLSDLASSTQVIFFTHHGHLVDIAKESLPQGRVAVHHLGG
jgi:uncharacterized protein YhaN